MTKFIFFFFDLINLRFQYRRPWPHNIGLDSRVRNEGIPTSEKILDHRYLDVWYKLYRLGSSCFSNAPRWFTEKISATFETWYPLSSLTQQRKPLGHEFTLGTGSSYFTSYVCLHDASLHIWIQLIIKLVCRFSRYNFCPCAILFPFIWIMVYFEEKLTCNLSKVCANAVRLIIWARVVFMDRFASYCDSIGTDLFSFNDLNTFSQRGHWYDVDDKEVTLWKYNFAFLQ